MPKNPWPKDNAFNKWMSGDANTYNNRWVRDGVVTTTGGDNCN